MNLITYSSIYVILLILYIRVESMCHYTMTKGQHPSNEGVST